MNFFKKVSKMSFVIQKDNKKVEKIFKKLVIYNYERSN